MSRTLLLVVLIFYSIATIAQEVNNSEVQSDSTVAFDGKEPLFLFNGQVINSKSDLDSINVDDIQEIEVIKKEIPGMINLYGEKARNGIIIIKSKDYVFFELMDIFQKYSKKISQLIETNSFDYSMYNYRVDKTNVRSDKESLLKIERSRIKKVKLISKWELIIIELKEKTPTKSNK